MKFAYNIELQRSLTFRFVYHTKNRTQEENPKQNLCITRSKRWSPLHRLDRFTKTVCHFCNESPCSRRPRSNFLNINVLVSYLFSFVFKLWFTMENRSMFYRRYFSFDHISSPRSFVFAPAFFCAYSFLISIIIFVPFLAVFLYFVSAFLFIPCL